MSEYFYQPRQGHGLPHDPFKAIIAPRPIARCGYAGDYAEVTTLFQMTRPAS